VKKIGDQLFYQLSTGNFKGIQSLKKDEMGQIPGFIILLIRRIEVSNPSD